MTMRLLSFAVWAIVSASAVFWITRLLSKPDPAPAHTITAGQTLAAATADLSRLLGSTRSNAPTTTVAPEPALNSRFRLVGVVASRKAQPETGLALIAVDGKPPRPVGLGGVVDGSLVLLAVNHRRAELGPSGGNATVTLELPVVPEPNRAARTNVGIPAINAPAPPIAAPAQTAPMPQTAPPSQPPLPGAVTRNPPAPR